MSQTETISKRLCYYVTNNDGTMDLSVGADKLTDEQITAIEDAFKVVTNLRSLVVSFISLESDFKSLTNLEADIKQGLGSLTHIHEFRPTLAIASFAEAQRLITNFLGSAAIFRDRAIAWFSKHYGNDPAQRDFPQTLYSSAYDSSLAYRILYNLRNYSAHRDIPLSLMPTSIKKDPHTSRLEGEIRLIFNSMDLTLSPKVQSKVRNEIVSAGCPKYEVLPLVNEYMQLHAKIMKNFISLHAADLRVAQDASRHLLTAMGFPPKAVPIIIVGCDVPQMLAGNYDYEAIPIDELGLLSLLHARLPD